MYEPAYITCNGYNHTAVVGSYHMWEDFCSPQALWVSTKADTSTQKIPALKTLQSTNLLHSKNSSSSVTCPELEGCRLKNVKAEFMHGVRAQTKHRMKVVHISSPIKVRRLRSFHFPFFSGLFHVPAAVMVSDPMYKHHCNQ